MNKKIVISILAVIANFILAIGKIVVGFISKSAAILADGINSGTDVVASTISFIGIKAAEKPADKKHPYGHGKAEVISGFMITLIIFFSGLFILYDAIVGFFKPEILALSILSFVVMGFSASVNAIMSYLKIYYGKKYNSYSLISDGIHSRIDFFVSLTIFVGLFFLKYFKYADSILALLVGIYIIKEAISLWKQTTDSLLGASAGEEIENEIKEIAQSKNIVIDSLKTQRIGNKIFAEIKIKLSSDLHIENASKITENFKQTLIKSTKNLEYVSIEIESFDISSSYYKPKIGHAFGWQRRGRFEEEVKGASSLGPGGFCICDKCGYKKKHEKGIPCSTIKCPKCGKNLKRDNQQE